MNESSEGIEWVAGFHPGYLGRIAQMHGVFYAREWGAGPAFEALMACELAEFYQRYDPTRDLLFTAHVDGSLVSSIAVDGSSAEIPHAARLRCRSLLHAEIDVLRDVAAGRAYLRGFTTCMRIEFI